MMDDLKTSKPMGTDPESWDRFWQNSKPANNPSWSKRRICKILDKYIGEGSKMVLDAGCGSGFFSNWFVGRGCNTVSLDFSQKALDATKELTGGRCSAYIQEDLTDKDVSTSHNDIFEVIFSDGLFEHFVDEKQNLIFQNMKRLLRPDGVIITFVPNLFTPWTLIRPFLMPGIDEKPFTRGKLKKLYIRNGCRVLESGGLNVLPMPLSPESLMGACCGMLVYCVGGKTVG